MKVVGPRTYRVRPSELPVTVAVRAVGLAANRAIVGDLRYSTDGEPFARVRPKVSEDPDALEKMYGVDGQPGGPAAYDITQTIEGWFGEKAPDSARYQLTITATGGDGATTSIRVPTVNPGVANLTFQVRSGS
jgi:hypothetical protein